MTPLRGFSKFVVYVAPLCAMNTSIAGGVALGDFLLLLLGVLALVAVLAGRSITPTDVVVRFGAVILLLLISRWFTDALGTDLEQEFGFFEVVVRGGLAVAAVALVVDASPDSRELRSRFRDAVVYVGLAQVAIAVLLVVANSAGVPLPVTGRGGPLGVTEQYAYNGALLPRPHGLFAEPADFGAFVAIALGLALRRPNTKQWHIWVLLAGVLISLSVSAVLLAVAVVLTSTQRRRVIADLFSFGRLEALVVVPLVVLVLVVMAPLVQESVEGFAFNRVQAIAEGRDESVGARVVGSWESARDGVESSFVVGSGFGYLGPTVAERGTLGSEERVGFGYSWNLTLFILGSGGLLALAAWIWLVVAIGRAGVPVLIPFLVWSTTTSVVLGGGLAFMVMWAGIEVRARDAERGAGPSDPSAPAADLAAT